MIRSILVLLLLATLISCESKEQKQSRLAKQYCGSCHVFPDPSLLPKEIWAKNVLPNMAMRMGLLDLMEVSKLVPEEDFLTIVSTIPSNRMVTEEEWLSILNYFEKNAPNELPIAKQDSLAHLTLFEPYGFVTPEELPLVTILKPDFNNDRFYLGSRNGTLSVLNSQLESKQNIQLTSPASHIIIDKKNDLIMSLMGIMDPNDRALGQIVKMDQKGHIKTIIDSLKRPVHFNMADLNSDSLEDFVVCEFGNFTGGLFVYQNLGDSTYVKHPLSNLPGARNIILTDYNKDGNLDIVALLAQGDEQIVLFINRGNFNFQQKTLLKFPPVYGSSYFEIKDFNKDGRDDILYTNGDNSDYSQIIKPYHGVRVFLQNSNGLFNESWFYHMDGASKALAFDFDKDGDLDIAAISFFPDFKNNPDQGFIYFENDNQQFIPKKINESVQGRWLILEIADLENDGDMDIFLGALDFNNNVPTALFKSWDNYRTSTLILKNKLH